MKKTWKSQFLAGCGVMSGDAPHLHMLNLIAGGRTSSGSPGPGSERWEIYSVLQDSPTLWGEDGGQRWDAVQAKLDAVPAGQAAQCCSGPQAAGEEDAAPSGACCG